METILNAVYHNLPVDCSQSGSGLPQSAAAIQQLLYSVFPPHVTGALGYPGTVKRELNYLNINIKPKH